MVLLRLGMHVVAEQGVSCNAEWQHALCCSGLAEATHIPTTVLSNTQLRCHVMQVR